MSQVIPIDKYEQQITKAVTVEQLHDLRAKLSASLKYAEEVIHKALGEKSEIEQRMTEARGLLRRIERRIGELLEATVQHEGGRPPGKLSQAATVLPPGVSRDESSRCQTIAAIPEEVFEAELEAGNTSQAHLVALGKQYKQDDKNIPDYFTVAQWRKLSATQMAEALDCPGKSVFNTVDKEAGGIEWAKWSWNPVTGCKHACSYCYARDIANRFPQKFQPAFLPSRLRAPANTKIPERARRDVAYKNVFTCSMSDLFGRWVPDEWIQAVLQVVASQPAWNFLFLTKFPKRLAGISFPDNAWIGTSVDCQARVAAAEAAFAKVGAKIKWLSIEPMLEPLRFKSLEQFQWIVLGGASRSSKTPEWRVPLDWWLPLHEQAEATGLRVFHKDNLFRRTRNYPGYEEPPVTAPASFNYLRSKSRDEIAVGEE